MLRLLHFSTQGSSTYDYECFRYNATSTFAFYVPYGTAYKSPQELVGTSTPERSDAPNPTLQWPSENNGKVTKIGQLVLPSTTNVMYEAN